MPFRCVKCQSLASAVGVFVASVLVLLLFAGAGIQLTITGNREAIKAPASVTSPPDPRPGDILKVLTLFLQYVAILGTLPVPFPASLAGVMSSANWMFAGTASTSAAWLISPFECVLQGLVFPAAIAKLLVYLSMPLVVAAVELAVFFLIYAGCAKRKKQQSLWHLPVAVVLLVSGFFTLPSWVQAVFSFFNCYSIQDFTLSPSLWWVPHMAQACYEGYHRTWALALGVPCLILCCAIPVVMFAYLWHNRKRLSDSKFQESYGHLYSLYRKRSFWWESVILGQTIVLVALSIFATQIGTYFVVVLVGVHLAFALQLLHVFRPYVSSMLQRLHIGSLYCLLLDVLVALLMFGQPARPTQARHVGIAQAAVAVFAVIVNVAYIVVCCGLIGRCFLRGPAGRAMRNMVARCGKLRSKLKPSRPSV